MLIIAGLGNPGKEYENTRHNAGFMVMDALAEKIGADISEKKHLPNERSSNRQSRAQYSDSDTEYREYHSSVFATKGINNRSMNALFRRIHLKKPAKDNIVYSQGTLSILVNRILLSAEQGLFQRNIFQTTLEKGIRARR